LPDLTPPQRSGQPDPAKVPENDGLLHAGGEAYLPRSPPTGDVATTECSPSTVSLC
jgi:hypothetical protein